MKALKVTSSIFMILSGIMVSIIYGFGIYLWFKMIGWLGVVAGIFLVPDIVLAILRFLSFGFLDLYIQLILVTVGAYVIGMMFGLIVSAAEDKEN